MIPSRVALLAALLLVLCVPEAHALSGVTLGDGNHRVRAVAGGPDPNSGMDDDDQEITGTGLTFSETISASASGSQASASMTMSIVENPADVTFDVDTTYSAQGGGDPDQGASGQTLVQREFTVTETVRFALTKSRTIGSGTVTDHFHEITLVGPNGPAGNGGTLTPGQYSITFDTGCGSTSGEQCAGSSDSRLVIDKPPGLAVVITAAPSGTVAARDATFEFTTNTPAPPPGHFECRIDSFGFAPCTSPKTFTNVPDGPHRVEIVYDPDGPDPPTSPAAIEWVVAPPCADVQVGLAVVQGCFTERFAGGQGTGVFETAGEAWIGGFHVRPQPGAKLVVNKNNASAPFTAAGPGVDWVLGPIAVPAPLFEIQPFVTDFAVSLNTAGTLERFINLPILRGLSAQVKATWNAGGRGSKVEASVSMEELTKNLGTPLAGQLGLGGLSIGTLAGKLGLTLANGRPTEVTEGELEVPEYAVELKGTNPPIKEGFGGGKLKARRVDAQTVEWSGEVTMLFPWASRSGTNQGLVTGRLFYRNFEMVGVGFALSGFEIPIAKSGWDFTGVQGDWIYRPSTSFNVGVTAQHHTAFAGVPVMKLTGNLKGLKLAEPDCGNGSNPVEFAGTFNAPPLEQRNIGELKGQLLMCAYVTNARNFAFEAGLSGELTIDAGSVKKLFAASGSAKGWFSGFDFNLDGSFQTQLPVFGQIGGTGVLSSEGYAFCGRVGFIQAGFATDNWLVAPSDIGTCDFTPYRAVPRASAGPTATASASARVRIPAGQSAFAIVVRGTAGREAPRVRLIGPNGERFVTPARTRALRSANAIIAPVDALRATYVYLRKPRPGSWRIETLNAASIRRIETARQLPKPRVRAKVKLKVSRVIVDWTSRRVPGQRIELVDRAADGTATTIQRLTSKLKGRVSFTPENVLATRRRIEAVVQQDGSPRPAVTVRGYRLRTTRLPGIAGRPQAKRATGGLAISWRKAAGARDYLVELTDGAEVLARATTAKLTVTLTGAPARALTVTITARDAAGRRGKAAVLKVPAG